MLKPKFNDLKPGEEIYYLEPLTQNIQSLQVVLSYRSNIRGWQMVCTLKPFKAHIPKEAIKASQIMFDTKIHDKFILAEKESAMVVGTNPPTIIATTKQELEEWMRASR